MQERWYRSPGESGAPQPGDIAVGRWRGREWTGPVSVRDDHWAVVGHIGLLGAVRVRYPTEPELAAYQLDPVAAGTERVVLGADFWET